MGAGRAAGGRVRARSETEVQQVVRACAELGVPVVPRGAGTGLSGGANAVTGCVVLDLAAMDQVLEIDPDNLLAVVQPGAVNNDVKAAVAAHGLWYPPDPASAPWSTIGGNVVHQRGRPVLPEVRRDARLRAGPARGRRGPGELRRSRPPRPPHHQGRGRAGPGQPVRRVRGHAGRGHRGDAAAAARAGRHPAHGRGRVRRPGQLGPGRGPDHPARADPGRAGAARPVLPGGGRELEAPGHRRGRERDAAGPGGHAG